MHESLSPTPEQPITISFLQKTWGVLTKTTQRRAQEKFVKRDEELRKLTELQHTNDPNYWAALALGALERYRLHVEHGRIPITQQYDIDGYTTELEVVPISTHPDGRKDEERRADEPHFVILTGAWGSGPQDEVEAVVLSQAMGSDGFDATAISYPEHAGSTATSKDGWKDPEAWEKTGKVIAEYLVELKQKLGDRPLILHGWSMGGTAIMEVLKHLESSIVDGIVFADTPLKKERFGKLAARFASYPVRAAMLGIKEKIVREKGFDTQQYSVSPLGLKVFLDRLREHRHPTKGIGFRVAFRSARAFAEREYLNDQMATELLKKHEVPVLVLRPSDDWVVPKHQLDDLVQTAGPYGQTKTISGTGHSLLEEQPRGIGAILKAWLETEVKSRVFPSLAT